MLEILRLILPAIDLYCRTSLILPRYSADARVNICHRLRSLKSVLLTDGVELGCLTRCLEDSGGCW